MAKQIEIDGKTLEAEAVVDDLTGQVVSVRFLYDGEEISAEVAQPMIRAYNAEHPEG